MGPSCCKTPLPASVQAEGYVRRERERRQRDQGGGSWKVIYLKASTAQSDKGLETGQVMVWRVSTWSYYILVLQQKVSKSLGTWMSKGYRRTHVWVQLWVELSWVRGGDSQSSLLLSLAASIESLYFLRTDINILAIKNFGISATIINFEQEILYNHQKML